MHLLSIGVGRCDEAVALADDGGLAATADGVHEPVSVVVVQNVDETPSAPWHPLFQPLSKVVKRHCYLHDLVYNVGVVCSKQHHLHPSIVNQYSVSGLVLRNSILHH